MIQDMEIDEMVTKIDEMKAEMIRLENTLAAKKQESEDFIGNYKKNIKSIRTRIDNMKLEETLNPILRPVPQPVQPHIINPIDADFRMKLTTTTAKLEHTQYEYDRLKEQLQREKNSELRKAKKKKRELDTLIESTKSLKQENEMIKMDIDSMKEALEQIRKDTATKQEMIEDYHNKTTKLATKAERIVQRHYRGHSQTFKRKNKF